MGGELLQSTDQAGARRGRGVQFRMPRRPALLAAGPPLVLPGKAKKQQQRKKKMAVARLGGGGGGRKRLLGAIRRLRMRWVAAAYRRAVRRLRAFYARALEDLLVGAYAISTLRAEAAGADYCSFGAAFAPVVSVPGRR